MQDDYFIADLCPSEAKGMSVKMLNISDNNKQRSYLLDAFKGIAIIAVLLYHFGGGGLPYGYLGVDMFLVLNGFF